MSREYDVTVCSEECGALTWRKFEDGPRMAWQTLTFGSGHRYEITMMRGFYEEGHCPVCGTRVGIDEDGRPWREAMVPRAMLEWLAKQFGEDCCPLDQHVFEPDNPPDYCIVDKYGDCDRYGSGHRCWMQAALRVSEETPDEATS